TRFSRDWSSDVCSSDLPLLEKLHHELSVQNVSFVAISDEPIEKTEKYCSAVLKVFDCYKLNTNFREIGIHKIPTVYVINKNGERSEERRVGKESRYRRG